MGGRPVGTSYLKNEVEMSEAIFGRSVEEAGSQIVMYKQGCAHYRTYWAESDRACSPEKDVSVSCCPSNKRRTRWWKVEK